MRPLPATVLDITPDWLNAALAGAPNWPGGTVTSVEAEAIGGENSLASAVSRLTVEVEQPDGSCEPFELLAKLHDPDASTRADGYYAAEAYFYREVAPCASVPVPETYIAEFDTDSRRLAIIQEFLSGGRIGSAGQVLDSEDLRRVLAALATLHAAWWESPDLDQLSGVRTFDVMRRSIIQFEPDDPRIRHFLDRFGELLSSALAACIESIPGWLEEIESRLATRMTLVHLDCTQKNVFIPNDPDKELVLFDWALFAAGNPALDLATLLCHCVDPAEHGRLRDLVGIYHEMIAEKGVDDYEYDALWDDFRRACLWRLVPPVTVAMVRTAAREAHVRRIIPLLDSVVTHTGAPELLDQG